MYLFVIGKKHCDFTTNVLYKLFAFETFPFIYLEYATLQDVPSIYNATSFPSFYITKHKRDENSGGVMDGVDVIATPSSSSDENLMWIVAADGNVAKKWEMRIGMGCTQYASKHKEMSKITNKNEGFEHLQKTKNTSSSFIYCPLKI